MVVANAKVEALEQNNKALREHVRTISETVRRDDGFAITLEHDDVDVGDLFDIGDVSRQRSVTATSARQFAVPGSEVSSLGHVVVANPPPVSLCHAGTSQGGVGGQIASTQRREVSSTASVASTESSLPPSPGGADVTPGTVPAVDLPRRVEHVSISRSNQMVAVSTSTPVRATATSTELSAPYFRPSVSVPPPGTPENIRAIRKGISSLDADIAALEQWLDRAADASVWTPHHDKTPPQ
jgi:hypothetical protein